VPIVKVPAGTQTCSIPNASVRACPAVAPTDGTGVGRTVAAGLAAAVLGAELGVALAAREAAGVATDAGGLLGVCGLDPELAQAATRTVVRSAAALAGRAFRGRSIGRCYPRRSLRRLEDPETAR
jgi:hypothetical protein